jgi:hypothetical protein
MTKQISEASAEALVSAVLSSSPSKGFTHTFYKYPARFSPEFARSAINTFSSPGDVVLDPFMGSGTTLVEAMVAGRHAIGADISSLAHFVSKVKTTVLTQAEISTIQKWAESIPERLNLRQQINDHQRESERDVKHLPWAIQRTIGLALQQIEELESARQREFARCALLRTAQRSLDCTRAFPTACEFRRRFVETLSTHFIGMKEVGAVIGAAKSSPTILCFNEEATALTPDLWQARLDKKPSLVITSPPYPSVHMLYHRWQIKGRRETSAPFWIAGTYDGQGESYYTMGGRGAVGASKYFGTIQQCFGDIHKFLARDAIVLQLIAFSRIRDQLPKYLKAMEDAGYCEVGIDLMSRDSDSRVWRQVPLRKWYASAKGNTSSSRELLLVHRRIDQSV